MMVLRFSLSMLFFLTGLGQLLSLILLIALAAFIFIRGQRAPLQISFIAANMSLSLWIFTELMLTQQPGFRPLIVLSHVGMNGLCLAFVYCGAVFSNQKNLSAKQMVPVALPLLLPYLLLLGDPLHLIFNFPRELHLYWGRLFPATLLAVQSLYLLIGFWLFCRGFWRQHSKHHRFMPLFWFGLMSCYGGYLLARMGLWPVAAAPVFLAMCLGMLGLIGLYLHAFDVTPLARRLVLNEISCALAITRPDNRLIDANLAMLRLFDPNAQFHLLMPIEKLSPHFAVDKLQALPHKEEVYFETTSGRRMFEMSVQPVTRSNKALVGLIYRLVELDQDQQMRHLLAEQNKHLGMANQSLQQYLTIHSELRSMIVRNQIAREMHDSLGHTLIILIAVLEKYKKQLSQNQADDKLLPEAMHLLAKAKEQLIFDERRLSSPSATRDQTLAASIENLGYSLVATGIRLETEFRGDLNCIPAEHWTNLLQICREAITNTMKHGQARTIHLFLIVESDAYRLIILDDGKGAEGFSKGFGLHGMQERVEHMNGTLRLQSDHSGFGIYARLPLHESSTKSSDA